ncbi:MAG: FkbM family methyltransferase [Anaerolineae bacterium]
MSILQRLKRHLIPSRSSHDNGPSFYKLSPTCQIPNLGIIYELYFGQRTDGCFVEVGAYDGEYASNTSGLADIGWSGHYIEPVPEYFERCKTRHARNKSITVSRYAIGSEEAQVEIHVGGPLSTRRDEAKRNFEILGWAERWFTGEKIQVCQVTLEDYLSGSEVGPGFELLVIDVEGSEWDVLRDFGIRRWRPQMVIIELHDQNNNYLNLRHDCNNIVRYFDDNGYKVVYKDFSNTIYVPKSSCPRADV